MASTDLFVFPSTTNTLGLVHRTRLVTLAAIVLVVGGIITSSCALRSPE